MPVRLPLTLLHSLFVSTRRGVWLYAGAACACVWFTAAAQGQSIAAPDQPAGLRNAPSFPSATSAVPDGPGVSADRDGRHPLSSTPEAGADRQRPLTKEHFAWQQFATDASKAGVRLAVPRLDQERMSGGSFMDGPAPSFADTSDTGMNAGMGGMSSGGFTNSGGMRGSGMRGGGGSAMAAGSAFLRSLGDSTGGTLGSTLHTLSGLTDSRSGYALAGTGSGVDFRLSGSMGNLMGSPMPSGGGASGLGGAGGHGAGGHGSGPSLSLKLKF